MPSNKEEKERKGIAMTPNDEHNSTPMFSRGASTTPFGKCTEEVKSLVPFEVKLGLENIAHGLGMNTSEFVRELIMIRVLGKDRVARIAASRLSEVAGIEC